LWFRQQRVCDRQYGELRAAACFSAQAVTRAPPIAAFAFSAAMFALAPNAAVALGDSVKAGECGLANTGTATGNTINCNIGVSEAALEGLIRQRTKPLEDLTAVQKDSITLLKGKLDLNERQVRAALDILGEKDVSPERLAAKLIEIANQYIQLKNSASVLPGDDAKIATLKADAQKAIENFDLAKADNLLAEAESAERAAFDRMALNVAETAARRGNVALTRLRYGEAAQRFAEAAALLPATDDYRAKRVGYLNQEANALYREGDEFGQNEALATAIVRLRSLLELEPRDRVPLNWAQTQNDLGVALETLGERESGTQHLNEAVAAFRAALEEQTRERVPLRWAQTQMNLGLTFLRLAERESGTERLKQAIAAYQASLQENTRERVPLDWAKTQRNLGMALETLSERESSAEHLDEAVAAYRAALEEQTRGQVPLEWARTQMDLGNALVRLAERESGAERLKQAIAAYRAALEEYARERVPLAWARTQMNLGNALFLLGESESGPARLEEAVAAFRAALQEQTRERVPLDWARTQTNLGAALMGLGARQSGTAGFEEAVAAFRAALQEQTRERIPLEWARTQMDLGLALEALGERESGTERLKQALEAFREALQEQTRERAPLDWATTQSGLRLTLVALGKRKRGPVLLEEAERPRPQVKISSGKAGDCMAVGETAADNTVNCESPPAAPSSKP
jgi:tetratricopeptide (TPR) repeat protein